VGRYAPLAVHVIVGTVVALVLFSLPCEGDGCYDRYLLLIALPVWAVAAIPALMWAGMGLTVMRAAAWVLTLGWIPLAASFAFGIVPLVL
jgi:hypothetical protein